MPASPANPLSPRKTPLQARSAASVAAILEATLQVLIAVGKERLTTTRVAARAGVSVGTLYQYFPNKRALLQAALRHHLEHVTATVEAVCREQRGSRAADMAAALTGSFLDAKMLDPKASVALYAVSEDVEGTRIVQQLHRRSTRAIAEMLMSASEPVTGNAKLVAAMLMGVMVGVSRRLLESSAPERNLPAVRKELIFLATAYVQACVRRARAS